MQTKYLVMNLVLQPKSLQHRVSVALNWHTLTQKQLKAMQCWRNTNIGVSGSVFWQFKVIRKANCQSIQNSRLTTTWTKKKFKKKIKRYVAIYIRCNTKLCKIEFLEPQRPMLMKEIVLYGIMHRSVTYKFDRLMWSATDCGNKYNFKFKS